MGFMKRAKYSELHFENMSQLKILEYSGGEYSSKHLEAIQEPLLLGVAESIKYQMYSSRRKYG